MTCQTSIGRITVGLLFFLISFTLAAQEEGIVLDPVTGDYIITYEGFDYETGARVWRRVVFVPATKIEPAIKSTFKETDRGMMRYRYKVSNSKDSKQALRGFFTIASHANEKSQKSPSGWHGGVNPNYGKTGVIISWFYRRQQAGDGLKPGGTQAGFEIESSDLPGVGTTYLRGSTPTLAFPDKGPSQELADKLDEITDLYKNSVPRFAAVPKIPVPEPFAAAPVLAALSQHLTQDLVSWKLIDPVLAQQLARLLDAAAEAAARQNLTAARAHLKQFRALLKQEHPKLEEEEEEDDGKQGDHGPKAHKKPPHAPSTRLIDRLAARVLDFDARYILKRLGGNG